MERRTEMIGPAEETPAAPPRMLRLPPEYDAACLGHTLDPLGPPRHVYSLTRMVAVHKRKHFIVADEDAAESVWNYIQAIAAEHPDRMPVFVEDSEFENRPKIWTPGG